VRAASGWDRKMRKKRTTGMSKKIVATEHFPDAVYKSLGAGHTKGRVGSAKAKGVSAGE